MSAVAIAWLALKLAPPGSRGLWVGAAVAAYSLPGAAGAVVLKRWLRGRAGVRLAFINAVLRTVGGAVGTAVAGVILSSKTISAALLAHTPLAGMSLPTDDAYKTAFIVCGVLGLAAAVVPFLVRARREAA